MFEGMMNEGFDLAAVASAAGLGGSAVAAIGAMVFFKGILLRILSQVVVTAVLTGVGFLALLNILGFEIVPRDERAAIVASPGSDTFSTQSATPEPVEEGKKTYAVRSPFRKG